MFTASDNLCFQDVVKVRLSDTERTKGTLTAENLAFAVSAMHRDGVCVLENAVDLNHVSTLNRILVDDAPELAKMPTTHFNNTSVDGRPTGNMSQGPPLDPNLMYTDIWANGPAAAVLSNLLGPNPSVNYVNGNTALGNFDNGARQRVHADLTFNHALFPFAIVTNYYLVDVSPANGSTELWLGSHRDTTFADHRGCFDDPKDEDHRELELGILDECLEERRTWAPPIRPTIKRGSVILRDLRLWHAGLCNPAPEPRIMLAFVHTPCWYQCPAKVVLPETARSLVEQWAKRRLWPLNYNAHFVPAHVDHKAVKFTPNFSSRNRGVLSMLPNLPPGFVIGDDEADVLDGENEAVEAKL